MRRWRQRRDEDWTAFQDGLDFVCVEPMDAAIDWRVSNEVGEGLPDFEPMDYLEHELERQRWRWQ